MGIILALLSKLLTLRANAQCIVIAPVCLCVRMFLNACQFVGPPY